MAVNIKEDNDKYYLVGSSRGLILQIDCSERIILHNMNQRFIIDYDRLINKFTGNNLSDAIDDLMHTYRLLRHPVFTVKNFATILAEQIQDIRLNTQVASINSIDSIVNKFNELNQNFTASLHRGNKPLPEVTLSKLLHSINPYSFWIIDSRVKTILEILDYPKSFSGFGSMLKDIFSDPLFAGFNGYIIGINNHPTNTLLKILDKILWFTR